MRFALLLVVLPLTALPQTCSTGIRYNTANTISPFSGNSLLAFARNGDLPYFSATINTVAPYTSTLPSIAGNQLLTGCFVANPPLVGPPVSYQGGAAGQRAAVIHSADMTSVGLAMLFFRTPTSVQVWSLNPDLTVTSQVYKVGVDLSSVQAADFNGDGKPDLAIVDAGDSSPGALWILLNNGDTSFKTPVKYPLTGTGLSVAAGDFNGDGKLDLAATVTTFSANGPAAGTVVIFLGNGDGTFRNAASYPAGVTPASIAVADLDGDGVQDLVIADQSGMVGMLLGVRGGTFKPFARLFTTSAASYVAIGDFNNDGHPDIAFTDFIASTVSVALGKGSAAFSPPQSYAVTLNPASLIVTDVNQDGHVDLIVGTGSPEAIGPDVNSAEIAVLMNNGDGSFQASPVYSLSPSRSRITLGDFDGDGNLDIAGPANVLFGIGGGKFATPSPVAPNPTSIIGSIASADFDADGKPDLVFGTNNAAALALSRQGRTFQTSSTPLAASPLSLVTGDFNGDGHPDVAAALGDSSFGTGGPTGIAVLPGTGKGTFGATVTTTGVTARYLAAADLNKDGKLDIVAANVPVHTAQGNTTPGVTVLLGKGDGSFTNSGSLLTSYAVDSVTLADVNGDGIPDLITAMSDVNFDFFVGVALGKGDGTFKTPVTLDTEFGASAIVVVDLNGDGIPDLAVGHDNDDLTYLLGHGDGTFQAEQPFGPDSYDVKAADLNKDGKPDLVFISGSTPTVGVLLSAVPAGSTLASVNGASFQAAPLAPESIASAFGSGLATGNATASTLPLPTNLNGTVVTVTDSKGTARQAPLFFASPGQVNYEIPAGTATGIAKVVIVSPSGQSSGSVQIASVAPAFFQANSATGLAAGSTLRVGADGTQTPGNIVQVNASGAVVASPIDLGAATDQVFLTLYATGVRNASSLKGVQVIIGGVLVPVQFAGPQGAFDGLDQVNVQLPRSLAGKKQVDVLLVVDGVEAPPVVITIQ